ncbi:MAG: hypothetical protein IT341_07050 [Chloroflexi bacterium]|nr:hypothetical protein [Chloroflexota bacterium]
MPTAKPSQSTRARRGRAEKQQAAAALSKYASRASLRGSQGPPVLEVECYRADRVFLVRRLNLMQLVNSGVFPRPITAEVRRIILQGVVFAMQDNRQWSDYVTACMRLAVEAVIVPPPELEAGDVAVDEITSDLCRPLFVEAGTTPDADQYALVVWDDYKRVQEEAIKLRRLARSGKADDEDREALAEKERYLEDSMALHFDDLAAIAGALTLRGPGAVGRFRDQPGAAVGPVADDEGVAAMVAGGAA